MGTLARGDQGEAVKELQRGLNRLGSLLKVDGDFGPGTEASVVEARRILRLPDGIVADTQLLERLAAMPELSPELTAAGVTFIGREEVSSPAEYRRRYSHPVLPPPPSGITIGIGYDLRYSGRAKLTEDWGEVLPPPILDRLAAVAARVGSNDLLAQVQDIEIPLAAAMRVFLARMLPEHIVYTRSAYPILDSLAPNRRTALISLVFNRGGSLDETDGRRIEMRRIRELLDRGDLDGVPAQFESMTRLWNPAVAQGVIDRRRREAQLWRDGFESLHLA
jgi:hypothetical protein